MTADQPADRDVEAVAAVLGDQHGCVVEHEDTGKFLTCRGCNERAVALLSLIREREAAAWDSAVQAVAWCLDNGEPSAGAALAYVAKNNPYAGSEGDDE